MSSRVFPLYLPDSARKLASTVEDPALGNDDVKNELDHSITTFSEIKEFGCDSDSSSSHGESPWIRDDLQDNPGQTAPIIPFENQNQVVSIIPSFDVNSAAEPQLSPHKAPSVTQSLTKLLTSRSLQSGSGYSVNGSSNLKLRSFGSSRNPLIEIIKQDLKKISTTQTVVSDEDRMKDLPFLYAFITILIAVTFICSYFEVGSNAVPMISNQQRR